MTPSDLGLAAAVCRRALEPLANRDWTVRAGDLDWDVRATLTHVCDAVGWYAAHLAVQGRHRLRLDFRVHDEATNAELLDVLDAAAATLAQVARAAPPDVRAYHSAGMADVSGFVAMGCDEVLVHGWDASGASGWASSWPRTWRPACSGACSPGRRPTWHRGPRCCGPTDVSISRPPPRLGPDWVWHCAPLDEWDGTIPTWNGSSPGRFDWDVVVGGWRPVSAP